MNGAFCLPCVLFGDEHPNKNTKMSNMYTKPLTSFKDALRTCRNHCDTNVEELHYFTQEAFDEFIRQKDGKSKPISDIIDQNIIAQISENKKKIRSIVDSVVFYGRQGIPLRGHEDSSKHYPEAGSYNTDGNVGNFIEIINIRIRSGDKSLEEHYKNCKKNASYLSKTTQNDLISCSGEVISDKIIAKVKKAVFFSILADEVVDASNKSQMALVIRYVDDQFDITEDFLGFIHNDSGLDGESLTNGILKALEVHGLEIENCRGQGYDGAGAVAGMKKGFAGRILAMNPKALYTHCYSHKLNLAVSNSSNVLLVQSAMEIIKKVTYFFKLSIPRGEVLRKCILDYFLGKVIGTLKDVCRTRWVERIKGFETFLECFMPIVFTLTEISEKTGPSKADAFILLKAVTDFYFIFSLVVTQAIFSHTFCCHYLTTRKWS